ncbi:type IV pilus assembly protein PilM [Candidatus Saccharibacteria bacterium]|nr:type IV pilus assembly protein PilM [Candidatus Saccharibacteria bacterium]MBR3323395.1 type IV pilus assembly protein PilM [Candidatus Saccharibacteria bacterium]
MSLLHGVGDFFAIDIGTSAIRMVQLKGDAKNGWDLLKFAYIPADPKILADDSETGQKKKGELIANAVRQAGITTKNVAIGMSSSQTFTTVIEVPNAPAKELEQTVTYELDQYIPMPIDEAQVDYMILGVSPNDPAKAEVLISSTATATAERSLEMVESQGLNVIAQEPEPIAMARSLTPMNITDARMVVDLGETSTDLVVVYHGTPRLVRSIPGGMQLFSKTLANNLQIEPAQARQFILKFGLAQDKLDGKVYQELESTLEIFASELMKSVRFFQGKYTNVPLGGIILSGFAGMIPFIDAYIQMRTNIATVQGNPWQYVRVTPEQQQLLINVASEFAVVIGLAERSND